MRAESKDGREAAPLDGAKRKPWVPPRLDRDGDLLDDVRQTKCGTAEIGAISPATTGCTYPGFS